MKRTAADVSVVTRQSYRSINPLDMSPGHSKLAMNKSTLSKDNSQQTQNFEHTITLNVLGNLSLA